MSVKEKVANCEKQNTRKEQAKKHKISAEKRFYIRRLSFFFDQ